MAIDLDSDLETFDDESYDDEAESDEAEFIGPLLSSLPIIGPILGGALGGPRRPPLRPPQPGPSGPGVSAASINTPRGSATIQLPEPLMTRAEFNREITPIRTQLGQVTTRLNTIGNDVQGLTARVGVLTTETKRDLTKVRTDLLKSRRETQAAIARMKREAASQATTSMLIGVLSQRQLQTSVDTHTHTIPHTHEFDATETETEAASAASSGTVTTPATSNAALMLLPLMMMGGTGGGGGDNMMPLMMMMAFMR
jgi:hypothetical protein